MKRINQWGALLSAAIVLSACTKDPNEQPPAPTDATYQKDVRALIETNCLGCHIENGIGPFQLDSYEAAKNAAGAIVDSIEAKRMPPWLPDPSCREFTDQRIMTDLEIATVRVWMENGAKEGDPNDYVTPSRQGLTPEELGTPSLVLSSPDAYTPNAELPDDYRCFVMDHEFTEETYLQTSNVVPDRQDLVHHVILYLIEEEFVPGVQALDDADEGPGYTCFGGSGAGRQTPIAGWVPGAPIIAGAPDAAIRIPAGAKVVMQMHYNLLAATTGPDQTEVQLWFTESRPDYLLLPTFFANIGIDINAGDSSSVQTKEFKNTSSEAWVIVATSPHMHLLGKSQTLTKVGTDGAEECIIDVPRWDFGWQQSYIFRDDDFVVVQPGETLRLECVYDNSAANQPIVNGTKLDPIQVRWGEGTLDEMCLNTIVFLEPYAELQPPEEVCTTFQPCYDTCMDAGQLPLTGCVLRCGGDDSDRCIQCALTGMLTCTSSDCGRSGELMVECITSCEDEACITNQCGLLILGYDRCARDHVAAGTCDPHMSACGGIQL